MRRRWVASGVLTLALGGLVFLCVKAWPGFDEWLTSYRLEAVVRNAILVKSGHVVLVRHGDVYGAFILAKQTVGSVEATDYTWFYRDDGKGTFDADDPAVKTGTGRVNVSGGADLVFGPFRVPWSGNRSDHGWIYHENNTGTAMCNTRKTSLRGIDATARGWEFKYVDTRKGG